MILTDDNFATIVKAVEGGRALYDNLLKYVRYQMGVLFGFIWTFLGAGVFSVLAGIPFVPQQTLYVNFTTQVLQSIGLGLGAPAEGLMERPPRPSDEKVMPIPLAIRLAIYGLVMGVSTLAVIEWADRTTGNEVLARSMGLATFSFANLFYGLASNDRTASVFSRALLANTKLLRLSLVALAAIILANELDMLNRFLSTTSMSFDNWMICAAAGSAILWVTEIVKYFERRYGARQPAAVPQAAVAPVKA